MLQRSPSRQWFLTSFAGAFVVAFLVVPAVGAIFGAGLFLIPIWVATFLSCFVLFVYLNPDNWALRMAKVIVASLVAAPMLGGRRLHIPLPWGDVFVVDFPDSPHWVWYPVLAILAAFLTTIHFRLIQRRTNGYDDSG